MAEDTDSVAQHFRLNGPEVGKPGVHPELQAKLERQLNKIADAEVEDPKEGQLSTTELCSGHPEEKPDGGSEDVAAGGGEEVSDAEASDDDDEPLEYAMLSVAAHLPSEDTAAILAKVKQHEAARTRREKEWRQRVATSEAAAKQAVAAAREMEAAKKEALLTALRDTDGHDDSSPRPPADATCRSPGSKKSSRNRGASELGCESVPPSGGRGGSSCCCCCSGGFCRFLFVGLLLGLGAFLAVDEHEREPVKLSILQGVLQVRDAVEEFALSGVDQRTVCGVSARPAANASGTNASAVNASGAADSDILRIEERIRCLRLVAVARRERLASLALAVVGAIAVGAVVALLFAVAYWKYVCGLAVAVLAGGAIFAVAIAL